MKNIDDIRNKTLEYFNGDQLATDAWIRKYSLKDSNGNVYEETPDDMHKRIAKELARIDKKYPNPISEDVFYQSLKDYKYIIPQGSPMAGIGNNLQTVSLSNCFVIGNDGPSDSYGGIMKIDEEQVQLMKRRGGVGHDLGHIRPKGSVVKNSALTSTGVVPFMERYSNSTREVAQDGRRGALMLSIPISHPDAEDFIDAKMEAGKVTGANISVKITDDFMRAVEKNEDYTQSFQFETGEKFEKTINAKKLWDKIIHNAWASAEPGIMFWDQMVRESLAENYKEHGFANVSTNPCGEIVLCPDDSCRLTAMNLYSFVNEPFTKSASFDWNKFKQMSHLIMRIMDNIVDLELEKIDNIIEKIENDPEHDDIKFTELNLWKRIKRKCELGRRTGVGITAEGDMLAALGYTYGTPEATKFAEEVHAFYATEVLRSSVNLAEERGAFPIFDYELEKNNPFIKRIGERDKSIIDKMKKVGRRNIALLTIAPTGTVSTQTQTTSGIEPAFMVYYTRRRKINPQEENVRVDFVDEVGDQWTEYNVFHHKFIDWYKINYDIESRKEAQEYLEKLPTNDVDKLVEKSPYYKAMANDVDWVEKVRMQGAIQKWIDHSISVTVNLPNQVDEELVNQVYLTGWKAGCKGITIYRDGSRSGVLIQKEEKTTEEQVEEYFADNHAPKRPKKLECDVIRFSNKGEKWIAFIGLMENRPYEIFTGNSESFNIPNSVDVGWIVKTKEAGVSAYHFHYELDGKEVIANNLKTAFDQHFSDISRMVSALMRHGMPTSFLIDLLGSLNLDGDLITTWKSGVKRILKKYLKDNEILQGMCCDNCNSTNVAMIEGCMTCKECGSSKCS